MPSEDEAYREAALSARERDLEQRSSEVEGVEASLAEQREHLDQRQQTLDEIERTLTWLRADLDLEQQAAAESARAVEARSAALASAIATSLRRSRFRRPHSGSHAASARSRRPSGRRWTRWAGYVTRPPSSPSVSAPSYDSARGPLPSPSEAVQEAPKIPASFREGLAALERASEERRRQPVLTACIRCGGCERCSCSTSWRSWPA